VLDDPFALLLAGPIWRLVEKRTANLYPETVTRAKIGGIVVRSRYAEDRLIEGPYQQYAILGAGLDSFVWRRPDLVRLLEVFEVDHPASQSWKRERAFVLGLPETAQVHYVPVDFEIQTLRDALTSSGFQWSKPTFFSWLGVTMYLTTAAIEDTLRTIAHCSTGSEIVMTYAPTDEQLDDIGRQYNEISDKVVSEIGEPILTRLSRVQAEDLVRRCGLTISDHPSHESIVGRYFGLRKDEMKPYRSEGLIAAKVP
jgi:methyltransferase (TIGR00027 family)